MNRSVFFSLGTSLLLLALGSTAQAQATYRIEQIFDPEAFATAPGQVNDRGEVIGSSRGSIGSYAWVWRHGDVERLPPLPGGALDTFAGGINDHSLIAGASSAAGSLSQRPALWHRDRVRDTGAFPDAVAAGASDITNFGLIVGFVLFEIGAEPLPYIQLGRFTHVLETLPGAIRAIAERVNERGVILGYADVSPPGATRAVIWKWGRIRELPMLPGVSSSRAAAINDRGDAVGEVRFGDGSRSSAVLWRQGRVMELPLIHEGTEFRRASAAGINNGGQIVGTFEFGDNSPSTPLLWQNGAVYDLNDLLRADDPLRPHVRIGGCRGLNNRGQIVVQGTDLRQPGSSTMYLLTPDGEL